MAVNPTARRHYLGMRGGVDWYAQPATEVVRRLRRALPKYDDRSSLEWRSQALRAVSQVAAEILGREAFVDDRVDIRNAAECLAHWVSVDALKIHREIEQSGKLEECA